MSHFHSVSFWVLKIQRRAVAQSLAGGGSGAHKLIVRTRRVRSMSHQPGLHSQKSSSNVTVLRMRPVKVVTAQRKVVSRSLLLTLRSADVPSNWESVVICSCDGTSSV